MNYDLFYKQAKPPKLIHQIFYVWGEKEMNELFKRSKKEFENIKGLSNKSQIYIQRKHTKSIITIILIIEILLIY